MTAATDRPADVNVRYHPDLEQGSEEWLAARCGIVTASVVGRLLSVSTYGGQDYECPECGVTAGDPCRSMAKRGSDSNPAIKTLHGARTALAVSRRDSSPLIVTPATGDDARSLTLSLVAERITQHVEQGYVTDAMWRGREEEPLARAAYAEHHAPVTEMGFITRRFVTETAGNSFIGYSPDGLVGDDGLIEIKSRNQKNQLQTILTDEVPAGNMAQLQCGLYVTGRSWIDYVSYSGGMPLYVKRVEPDFAWLAAIASAVDAFETTAAGMVEHYASAVVGLPVMERTPEIPEMRV